MWELNPSRLFKRLRYQQIASIRDDALNGVAHSQKVSQRKSTLYILSHIAISCLCLLVSISFFFSKYYHEVSDEKCVRRFSAPSPAMEAVELEWLTFNDNFQPDEYSGYPSATSEKAWGALWDFGAFTVPLESLAGLNKSSMTGDFRLVGSRPDAGVGGLLEGAHQIHCLNLVRQFIYRDHWDYSKLPSFSGGEKTRRHHVDHCIETLRLVFSCQSDVTPYYLVTGHGGKTESRGLPHKCRKYSKLVDWVNSHSVFDTVE
ncbi:oxidase ustYa family protein [Aspergillus ibericus CBS 121593]|uniref:Tat pathway signal sequence n=1 Tax=Aspergillus ibericus CBS 121593 TaxID=1448316 RepID=A0A395GQS3_9EURO|nr:hypothetical protein BO80DRAFT_467346 [Aspergillus ibericus CBS 121593]RAK97891.1 hypothetical protein BO80DRAFT_467346 [Aspergillus ibericus CBS 121593]